MDGVLPTEEFMGEEFVSLANEHKVCLCSASCLASLIPILFLEISLSNRPYGSYAFLMTYTASEREI